MQQLIPLTNSPNQSLTCVLNVDGETLALGLDLNFNETAGYWELAIFDSSGTPLLSNIPLLCGGFPSANLLGQFIYMALGSAYIINASGVAKDSPDDTDLGTDFVLIWGDTPEYTNN